MPVFLHLTSVQAAQEVTSNALRQHTEGKAQDAIFFADKIAALVRSDAS